MKSPTATRVSLETTLSRIVGRITTVDPDALGPPVNCVRCKDYGIVELTGGEYRTPRGAKVTATPDKPVYRTCTCQGKP